MFRYIPDLHFQMRALSSYYNQESSPYSALHDQTRRNRHDIYSWGYLQPSVFEPEMTPLFFKACSKLCKCHTQLLLIANRLLLMKESVLLVSSLRLGDLLERLLGVVQQQWWGVTDKAGRKLLQLWCHLLVRGGWGSGVLLKESEVNRFNRRWHEAVDAWDYFT